MIYTKTLTNPREKQSTIKDGCSWKSEELQHVGSIQCSDNQASTISGAGMETLVVGRLISVAFAQYFSQMQFLVAAVFWI